MKIVRDFRFELTKRRAREPPPLQKMKIFREIICGDYILYPIRIPSSYFISASGCQSNYVLEGGMGRTRDEPTQLSVPL